jgi:nucleoside-diphosphate-sugar epimerase
MKRVLVTGATGFVGQHLCRSLLEKGYAVRGTYRSSEPASAAGLDWARIVDLENQTNWGEALEGIDYVVHLAALAHQVGVNDADLAAKYQQINFEGTAGLARAVARQREVQRFVFISSAKALPIDGVPMSEYGLSKRAAEDAIKRILIDTDWCIVRPCLVYGPGNLGNMSRLIRLLKSGLPLPFGAIQNSRSFLFVGNLVDAIERCLKDPRASRQTFNVSDGDSLSTPELVRCLARHMGKPARLISVPVPWMREMARFGDLVKRLTGVSIGWDSYSIERLCSSFVLSNDDIQQVLGWAPPYSVENGIRCTVESERS